MTSEWERAAERGDRTSLASQIAAGADLRTVGSGAPGFARKTAAQLARDRGLDELAYALSPPEPAA